MRGRRGFGAALLTAVGATALGTASPLVRAHIAANDPDRLAVQVDGFEWVRDQSRFRTTVTVENRTGVRIVIPKRTDHSGLGVYDGDRLLNQRRRTDVHRVVLSPGETERTRLTFVTKDEFVGELERLLPGARLSGVLPIEIGGRSLGEGVDMPVGDA